MAFRLPEPDRRSLLIVAVTTLAIALLAVLIIVLVAGRSGAAAPEERSYGLTAPGAGLPTGRDGPWSGAPRSDDLLLSPAKRLAEDWTWRGHIPPGEPWSEETIARYWTAPEILAEEYLEDRNDELIRSILGVSE